MNRAYRGSDLRSRLEPDRRIDIYLHANHLQVLRKRSRRLTTRFS